jgi:hypothetical protein
MKSRPATDVQYPQQEWRRGIRLGAESMTKILAGAICTRDDSRPRRLDQGCALCWGAPCVGVRLVLTRVRWHGSSSSRRRGRAINARAIASIGLLAARQRSGRLPLPLTQDREAVEVALDGGADVGIPTPVRAEPQVVEHTLVRKDHPPLGHQRDPVTRAPVRRPLHDRGGLESHGAAPGTSPQSVRNIVVFPRRSRR